MGEMTISSNLLEMLSFIITRHVRPISLPIAMVYSSSAIVEYIYMPSVELDSRLIPMYSRMVIRLFWFLASISSLGLYF